MKDLLLEQIEKVKKGDFPDWLLSAVITDMKLQQTKMNENNNSRVSLFVDAFITNSNWKEYISTVERLSKITKKEVMDFANANYSNNYVLVYKRNGEDKNVQKVVKPVITPVEVNRNDQSAFLKNIINIPVKDIEPVFIDYTTDIKKLELKNKIQVFYAANTENKTFDMYYILDMGTNHNKKLSVAINYLKYLGTKDLTAAAVTQEFYKLGCSFNVYAANDQVWVSLSGLTENIEKATKLFEDLLANAQPNEEALKNLVADIFKKRDDAKLSKGEILNGALVNYGKYGKQSSYTNILSSDELKNLNSKELISIINGITSFQHRILYYGSNTSTEVVAMLNNLHKVPATLIPIPAPVVFKEVEANNNVYVVDYDMKQAEVIFLSKNGTYAKENTPMVRIFNEYFGGGMSSVVFQEMRESKALAYSVFCTYNTPRKKSECNYVFSYIGTQADKLPEAMKGMMELINNMPESENNFKASKESILQSIRSERITRAGILFNYEGAQRMGLDYDIRKDVFKNVPNFTLSEVKTFEQNNIKNKQYTVLVIGKKESLDMKTLEKYGKITFLTLQDVFGY